MYTYYIPAYNTATAVPNGQSCAGRNKKKIVSKINTYRRPSMIYVYIVLRAHHDYP